MPHPAIAAGNTAVITGAAGGIGLAAARRLQALGMNVCVADRDAEALERAASDFGNEGGKVIAVPTDVSSRDDVMRLKDRAYEAFGAVHILMNNAGVGDIGGPWSDREAWARVLGVNLWGVLNGLEAFTGAMIAQGAPAAIINLGSKQGITTPPGNAAYNVSKAGVKVVTEQLAHELRQIEGCRISAHLLVPGFTFTGMTAGGRTKKPADAWTPGEVVDFMLAGIGRGDFYLICPDNAVTPALDHRRMQWAISDITENRPALSRWHPDYKDAFAAFVRDV